MSNIRQRAISAVCCIAAVAFGLFCVKYRGVGYQPIRDLGISGAPYVMMWMFAFFAVWPKRGVITPLAITVCLYTCGMEFLQLCKAPVLENMRDTFVGAMVLGNQFDWMDFPAYPIGCLLGWFALRKFAGTEEEPEGYAAAEHSEAAAAS